MFRHILIIILILVILILGQQSYFIKLGKIIWDWAVNWFLKLWNWIVDYWNRNIAHSVTSEIQKRQEVIKTEINNQAQQTSQGLWDRVKNFFIQSLGGSPQTSK